MTLFSALCLCLELRAAAAICVFCDSTGWHPARSHLRAETVCPRRRPIARAVILHTIYNVCWVEETSRGCSWRRRQRWQVQLQQGGTPMLARVNTCRSSSHSSPSSFPSLFFFNACLCG
eukprot:777263-Rhodomonas_salina.2